MSMTVSISRILVGGYCLGAVAVSSAVELPNPCAAGSCGPNVWVAQGAASAVHQGNSLTINQTTNNAILNWQSFNISVDGSVEFKQPDASSVALNRIFQADPSKIFGSLSANGRIYLVNQNGILFGDGARVNVGGLVASTLNLRPEALEQGLAAGGTGTALASPFPGGLESQPLILEKGASLTADGGQIFLFAPRIENAGNISTPDGQTILAAGQSVFLSSLTDPNLRGLIVSVEVGGEVTNGDAEANAAVTDPSQLVGQIVAERGNVTLAGLTVNQEGRISATTSVRANGSIRLIASQGPNGGGNLTLAEGSRTEVLLDDDTETKTVDVNDQPRSTIALSGNRITLERNSAVVATGGNIQVRATSSGTIDADPTNEASDSRIFIDDGAVLDVSGAHTTLGMDSNMLTVELRGSQLADSPDQRNGALRGQRVQIDIRRSGTREDGTTWQGSPIGVLDGDISTVARDVTQRNLAGGKVELLSQGDVIVADGATINVSGGSVQYEDGYLTPSALLGVDGRIYDIGDADPLMEYVGVLNGSSYVRVHQRWGLTEHFQGTFGGGRGRFESGYVEGKDAGSLSIIAPNAIFDGRLQADRIIGPHQRRAPSSTVDSLYRPYDQVPLGGEFLLGPALAPNNLFVVPDVTLTAGLVLPGLLNPDGSDFDPLTDPIPDSVDSIRMRPELFGEGAATRVTIRSDGSVLVPEEIQLTLPAWSSLGITARDVDFGGTYSSPGGSVTLRAQETTTQPEAGQGELLVRDSARIDVAGAWVNESVQVNPGVATEALAIDGGSVQLRGSNSDVTVESGSVIDVSGGARLTRDGDIESGDGGAITAAVSTAADDIATFSSALEVSGELHGYSLEKGGSLSLSAGEICIGLSIEGCGASMSEDALLIDPERFRTGGFSSYTIASNARGLSVGSDATVVLQAENLLLNGAALLAPSASSLAGLTSVALAESYLRRPVDLTLSAAYLHSPLVDPPSAATFADLSVLSVERGASIIGDPGARISLDSNTALHVDGTLSARAGQIALTLNNDLNIQGYLPSQSIWLGDHADLSVAGLVQYQPNDQGLLQGEVLAGGSITLIAERGYIATNPLSRLDVSGAAGQLDIPNLNVNGVQRYERRNVASRAGEMSFTAAEGLFLNGDLFAQSGDPASMVGGSLFVALDASNRYLQDGGGVFPERARLIEIASTASSIAFGAGAPLAEESSGRAVIAADQIEAAGFDHLRVEARTRSADLQGAPLPGEIVLGDGLDLSLRGSITLDTATVLSDGGQAVLQAPLVSLGQHSTVRQEVPTDLTSGTGELEVRANQIEVIGNSALNGFADVALRADGDISLRGTLLDGATSIDGSLRSTGALTLSAQRIYPTTLSHFTVIADEPLNGSITVEAAGGNATSPLYSAAGSLTLRSPTITQGGVLRAPFGTISLEADELNLLAGSTTATNAEGLVIPFGQTQGGFDWIYELGGKTLVYGSGDRATLPSQSVSLNATAVDVESGATIDTRGGGDMVAYEWIPGVGGTQDVLSAFTRPDAFVIVPAANWTFAPYDPALYLGSTIQPGESVYLEGGGGVAAGNYVVLPARYAFLPGAYYVRPVDGFQDLTANRSNLLPDGSTLVGGYRTFGATGLRLDGRNSGFSIRPGAEVMNQAQYTQTTANEFFANQAIKAGVDVPRLPRDAGVLSITAGTSLQLNGDLLGTPDEDGRGTLLDISSDALRVVASSDVEAIEGVVDIDGAALSRFGAESILLGGTRATTDEGTAITTRARSVEVTEDASLTAPELMLVASESVSVREGATLTGEGELTATATDISLEGDGALLRVTSGADVSISRANSSGTGQLIVESGSVLAARGGTVAAESSGGAQFAPTLDVAGGVLSLTGNRISLGDVADVADGLTLSNEQLASLALDALSLSSRSSIDFYGSLNLAAGDLSLQSSALRGFGEGAANVSASGALTLQGGAASADSNGTGTGSLTLGAEEIVLAAGDSRISGFATANLQAANTIEMQDDGALEVAGDASLSAARLTASSGSTRDIKVSGALAYTAVQPSSPLPADGNESLGARIDIDAASIEVGGRIDLHSGVLNMVATAGDVTLAAGADVRMNGVTTAFDSVPVGSRGGWLTLESRVGDVTVADGASINVAAGAGTEQSDRGRIQVSATQGTADMQGALTGGGADYLADAAQVADFAGLNSRLGAGDFSGDRAIRQRGPGDLVVGATAGESMDARSVQLVADQGSVNVDGAVRSHSAGGGRITLAARDGVTVNGTLDVSAADSTERNGRIDLQTTTGRVQVGANAHVIGTSEAGIDHSFADGTLNIRAPRDLVLTLADADATNNGVQLAGDMTRLNAINIEGFATYQDQDGAITADEIAAAPGTLMYDEAANFAAQSNAILAGLGTVRGPAAQVLAGIEITSTGNLDLQSEWSLNPDTNPDSPAAGWRFNGLPGVLTLRAAGDLTFSASLTDGFTASEPLSLTQTGQSWSYRLAAGADLTSADLLAVNRADDIAGGTLHVAAGGPRPPPTRPNQSTRYNLIRTGTGSIDIAAARNVELGSDTSAIYTAGIATDGVSFGGAGELGSRKYPAQGGDIRISAGQDVIGASTNQLVSGWLNRIGKEDSENVQDSRAPAWTVNFNLFRQNIGALGGGDVSVNAGRDVLELSAVAPTVGRQVGGTTLPESNVEIIGGGNVDIRAQGSVRGGMAYSGLGRVDVVAADTIAAGTNSALAPVIGLGDAQAHFSSRGKLELAGAFNPTLLTQGTGLSASSFFSTYTDQSALSLVSASGDIQMHNDRAAIGAVFSSLGIATPDRTALTTYAPNVSVAALRGDVVVSGSMGLAPAKSGGLQLLAQQDVEMAAGGQATSAEIIISDADPEQLGSLANPQDTDTFFNQAFMGGAQGIPVQSADAIAVFNADISQRLKEGRVDFEPSRIVAQEGDIRMAGDLDGVYSAESMRVVAGRDILNVSITAQNLQERDVSSVIAGRDLTYPLRRDANGKIQPVTSRVVVDGPGTLEVRTGRDLDLQTSGGVTSRGNTFNPALPEEGADISLQVGTASRAPDYAGFLNRYLASAEFAADFPTEAAAYRTDLIAYMKDRGLDTTDADVALNAFRQLSASEQAPLLERILFSELQVSGRFAAAAGENNGDFTRGFTALTSFYPGANPDLEVGEANPYIGDMNLYFSRIYTVGNGDIRLLAPGGEINAGLASPPSAFNLNKGAEALGVVAQRSGDINALSFNDFLVNESRVFAADGGNILVWATQGDIDAGRGAKTAISAPPPTITFDESGIPQVVFPPALQGSGIQTIATTEGRKPGDVDLFAPRGVVNAGDAGIVAGNLTIAATAVLGADNIQVSGVAVGVPVDTGGLGAALAGVSNVGSSASNAATTAVEGGREPDEKPAALSDAALSWLEVFVVGLGEDNCKQDDIECMKRQKTD